MAYDPINTLVTVATGGSLFFLLKNVLPAYFTEKGKNLATKEDIGEITNAVESVKQEFTEKTEQLRSTLQFSNQILISIKTEERNAIIACYEKYHKWLNTITSIAISSPSNEGLQKTEKALAELEIIYIDVQAAEDKMNLFITDSKYISLFSELKIKTLKLSNVANEVLLKCSHAISRYLIVDNAMSNTLPNAEERKREAYRIASSEMMDLITDYRENTMLPTLKDIVKMSNIWRQESLRILTKLYDS
jgi:hypothetical protein